MTIAAHVTFNQIGIHMVQPGATPGALYALRYRPVSGVWKTGLPAIGADVAGHILGNVLYLAEGTSYEIEVTGPTGIETVTATTRVTPATPALGAAVRVRYVSPAGSGTAYTAGAPGSLTAALASLQAGDHIVLLDGTYYNAGNLTLNVPGTQANPVVLRAAPGATPKISGADPAGNGYAWASVGGGIWSTTLPYTAGEIFIDRGTAAGYERLLQPPTYSQFQNFTPYTHPVRHNAGNTLYVHLPNGASPATLPRVICKEYNRWAQINGAWLIVDGITFEHWWNQLQSWKITVDIFATDATFRNCKFNRTGTLVPGNGADRLLVEDCTFEDGLGNLGYDSIKVSWYSTTAPVDDASCILTLGGGTFRNGVLRRNRHINACQSISVVCLQGSLATTGAINCYIEGNEARCVANEFPEVDGRASLITVKDNVGVGGVSGMGLSKPNDGVIWAIRNLWVNTGQAMVSPPSIYGGTTVTKTNSTDTNNIAPTYFVNNTIYSEVPLQYGVYAFKILSTGGDTPFVKLYAYNNIFFTGFGPIWIQPSATNHIFNYNLYRATTWNLRYGASNYASVAAWRTATGQEANGVQADPLFINKGGALAADYELQGGSPALNAGVAIPGLHDVWGFAATPNIGFAQVATPTAPPVANWTQVVSPAGGETGFRVERSATGAGAWSQIALLLADVGMYSDENLSAGATWYYRVGAYNASGTSYSAVASATTPGGDPPPQPPTDDELIIDRTFLTLPPRSRVLTVRKHVR